MNAKTIYLLLLGFFVLTALFLFETSTQSDFTEASKVSLPNQSLSDDTDDKSAVVMTTLSNDEQTSLTKKMVFLSPKTPRVLELRNQIMIPVQKMQEADMVVMGDAMSELAKMRSQEATNVLAELLFADKQTYFKSYYIKGLWHSSFSYQVMGYLYRLLESTPEPLNGAIYQDEDLVVFQDWWLKNKDHLVFRDPNKPVPMPRGMRGN
jgi:hypothetical protein